MVSEWPKWRAQLPFAIRSVGIRVTSATSPNATFAHGPVRATKTTYPTLATPPIAIYTIR